MNTKKISTLLFTVLLLTSFLSVVALASAENYTIVLASSTGGNVFAYLDDGSFYRVGTNSIPSGTHIQFVATAVGPYVFDHWNFVQNGANGTVYLSSFYTTIQSSFTLQAFFSASIQNVTVTFADSLGGTIIANWNGVNHNSGTYPIQIGTQVVLTGNADPGFYFSRFFDGTQNFSFTNPTIIPLSLGADGRTMTAYFVNSTTVDTYLIDVSSTTGGSITCEYTPSGSLFATQTINEGVAEVAYGSSIILNAAPTTGNKFDYFDLSGPFFGQIPTNHFEIAITGNLTVVGTFESLTSSPTPTSTPINDLGVLTFIIAQFTSFRLDATSLIIFIFGAIMACVASFMLIKNIKLWVLGFIILVASLAFCLFSEPSILSLVIWAIVLGATAIFTMIKGSGISNGK